jgi:hypothetical protein
MLDLNDFRYFVRIVECGGLTAASRNLTEIDGEPSPPAA